MAFHNTSERYNYIYGNNVRKPDYERDFKSGSSVTREEPKKRKHKQLAAGSPAKKTKTVNPETAAAVEKNRAKLLEFDWKYTVVTSAAILICAISAMAYVGGTVHLNSLSTEISSLKTEKTELESKQAALQAEIDKNINLDEIRTFAEEELHMSYPDQEHVIYYMDNKSDYFRQYESVNVSK